MRASVRSLRIVALLIPVAAAGFIAFGCSGSNEVTSPTMGAVSDVSGTWSGQYQSNAPVICGSGAATATFVQDGDRVQGPFQASDCGINGTFRGRVSGNVVTGTVGMLGCTGGKVTGRLDGGGLSLTIGDFHKDLIAGDVEVLPGGQVRLQR